MKNQKNVVLLPVITLVASSLIVAIIIFAIRKKSPDKFIPSEVAKIEQKENNKEIAKETVKNNKSELIGLVVLIISCAIYFSPAIIAKSRSHVNTSAIAALLLVPLFGLFFSVVFAPIIGIAGVVLLVPVPYICWGMALVWSFTNQRGTAIKF